jgi:putative transposase
MINHVHLLVSPNDALGMAQLMKRTQGGYALYLNRKHHRASGHLWQSRYYSALVSPDHVWMVLRYIERNPVRAQLITEPANYAWSSAKHHLAPDNSSSALDVSLWAEAWSPSSWAEALGYIEPGCEHTIREATRRGYPIGPPEFVKSLQDTARRNLISHGVGRPRVKMKRELAAALSTGQSEPERQP